MTLVRTTTLLPSQFPEVAGTAREIQKERDTETERDTSEK